IGILLTRSIVKPLNQSVRLADSIALGDLSGKLEIKRSDELGALADPLNKMVANLPGTAKVADTIAAGELYIVATLLSDKDTLGHSLSAMLANLRSTAEIANKNADGDLTAQARALSEKDSLGNSLAKMVGNLRNIVGEVTRAADNVAS